VPRSRVALSAVGTLSGVSVCGVTCDKTSFSCTVVADGQVKDHDIVVPPGLQGDRPQALSWLLEEAERFFQIHRILDVRVWSAPSRGRFAASSERAEVEACIKIAAHHGRAVVRCMDKEKVRAAYGLPKATGAYDTLLARPDVHERGNDKRRNQYLMAKAPAE